MYRTNDGTVLRSTEASEIVAELNDISYTPEKTAAKFMTESAGRILAFSGRKIRVDTAENYVADLVEFGFLTSDADESQELKKRRPI